MLVIMPPPDATFHVHPATPWEMLLSTDTQGVSEEVAHPSREQCEYSMPFPTMTTCKLHLTGRQGEHGTSCQECHHMLVWLQA